MGSLEIPEVHAHRFLEKITLMLGEERIIYADPRAQPSIPREQGARDGGRGGGPDRGAGGVGDGQDAQRACQHRPSKGQCASKGAQVQKHSHLDSGAGEIGAKMPDILIEGERCI